jgi:thiamine pyrophosphokinase
MRAVVVAGGEPDPDDSRWLDGAALVIAADAGAVWLDRIGRLPDVLIGDLDSIDPERVRRLGAGGVRIDRYPTAKDASDTELAVRFAVDRGAHQVVILGALGGDRLDHGIANLLLPIHPGLRRRCADVRVVQGRTLVRAVHAGEALRIEAPPGSIVSLLPAGGDAQGVRTTGLRYRLDGEPLPSGSTRGLSNEVVEPGASVALAGGTLLVFERAGG